MSQLQFADQEYIWFMNLCSVFLSRVQCPNVLDVMHLCINVIVEIWECLCGYLWMDNAYLVYFIAAVGSSVSIHTSQYGNFLM